jgi:hypothetical protein
MPCTTQLCTSPLGVVCPPHTALCAGTQQQLQAELARLRARLADVAAGDAAAAATVPDAAGDASGRLLRLLLTWRQQRKAGLQLQVARLEQLVRQRS